MQLAAATASLSHEKLQIPGAGTVGTTADIFLDDMGGARSSAAEVFGTHDRLLIVGAPGAGKTTLMRNRAFEMAQAYLEDPTGPSRVPLLIFARSLPDAGQVASSHDYVVTLARYCEAGLGVEVDPAELAEHLRAGSIDLLVDGLDELGLDWNRSVSQLSDLFRSMPNLRGTVSSRPAALTVRFSEFIAYTIADLDFAQIEQIVAQATIDQPQLRERFAQSIRQSAILATLARSPLLLRIMLALFVEMGALPTSRSLLYSSTIDVMLSRWDARRPPAQNRQARLARSDLYAVLGAVASHMFWNSQNAISREELTVLVHKATSGVGLDPRIEASLTSAGMFAETGSDEFSFAHKSFMEYFTAWSYRDDVAKLIEIMSREDGEAVLEFASGIVENPGILIEKAVAHNHLVLAAKMSTTGRFDNDALQHYVAQAFRKALDPRFLALLAPSQDNPPHSPVDKGIVEIDAAPTEPAVEPLHDDDRPMSEEDRLLSMLDDVRNESEPNEVRGRLFEEFAGEFFGRVFRVAQSNYLTDRGEIDLLLELEPGGTYWADFGNEALVECKNLSRKASYDQAATFITKLKQSRRKLGFIVSYLGFTRDALQAIHDNAADTSNALVIAIAGEEIRRSLQLSEQTNEFFKNTYRNATIPKRGRRRTRSSRSGDDD